MTTTRLAHQKRLRRDPDDLTIKVRQQQPRKLKPTLVTDMRAGRRRPVQTRQMPLPTMRTNRPPRAQSYMPVVVSARNRATLCPY
jgi:hypothetical protein